MLKVNTKRVLKLVVLVLSSLLIISLMGYGEQADKFFEGKVLEFYCPYKVGGGFDTYSRAIANYLPRYLPVKATIVKNFPGGGGLVGTNQLYTAPADGLVIGIINGGGAVFNQVLEVPGVRFDLAKMSWVGRITAEPHVIGVGMHTPFYTIDDIQQARRIIVFSATGKGSDDYLGAFIIAEILGFSLRQVVGFETSSEANLAVIRGEVDGTETTLSTLLPLIKSRDIRPVLQIALERDYHLFGVPTALEVAPEDKKDIAVAITNTFALGRAIAGPPGIPKNRLKVLRDAVDKVLNDPDFVEELEKRGRPVTPMRGEQVEQLVSGCMSAAEKIKPLLKKAIK